MKLSVNLITGGKYYRAGEEIPDGLISGFAAELAAHRSQDAATNAVREPPAASTLPADAPDCALLRRSRSPRRTLRYFDSIR